MSENYNQPYISDSFTEIFCIGQCSLIRNCATIYGTTVTTGRCSLMAVVSVDGMFHCVANAGKERQFHNAFKNDFCDLYISSVYLYAKTFHEECRLLGCHAV
jgi:hypothetical protein